MTLNIASACPPASTLMTCCTSDLLLRVWMPAKDQFGNRCALKRWKASPTTSKRLPFCSLPFWGMMPQHGGAPGVTALNQSTVYFVHCFPHAVALVVGCLFCFDHTQPASLAACAGGPSPSPRRKPRTAGLPSCISCICAAASVQMQCKRAARSQLWLQLGS